MNIEPADDASAFALVLLRAAVMLTGLAEDLVDDPAADCPDGDASAVLFIERVSGSIVTAVEEADPQDLRRATELIGAACERVLEHLRLALELSRRIDAEGGTGPGKAYG